MKKLIVFLTILCALGLLTYHLPRLLDLRPVRAQVAARVSAATGWQVEASRLRWDWFPVPHFSLNDITMTRGGITIAIPETRIYPRWLSLLHRQFDLGELKLVRPKIAVAAWPPKNSESPLKLPNLNLTIVEGTALIAAAPFAKGSARSPLVINAINSRLRLSPDRCDLKVTCASALFSELQVQGNYKTGDQSYQFDYGLTGLDLGNLVPDLLDGRLRPKISGLSMQGSISGQGAENYRVQVEGDFPCFLLPRSPEKSLLDCGEFVCTIDKNPQTLSIAIAKLKLKNPAAVLNGRIAVSQEVTPTPTTTTRTTAPAETWLIDLNGQDLDVGAIRQKVLAIFGDHQVAQLVCDIVRSGTANRASYYFKGPLTDFQYLEKMRIKVDVDRAEIHPPGTKLDLMETGGPIEIRDGFLSGAKLHARLGNSAGSNCGLYLDLLGRKNEFRLDLDIEADLADLPQVLLDEVKHQGFHDEVRRFHHCQGRAHGHLSIGDTLDNPAVTVLVDSMAANGEYDRVSWPFSIGKGTLAVYPDRVSWRNLKGEWGPNLIHDSSGEVGWQGPVQLKLGGLNASLALAPLLKELNDAKVMPAALQKAVGSAEGTLELKKAEFAGRLDSPESWRYSGYLATKGSRWTSPLLPQPFLAETADAFISQEKIDLGESRLRFNEQTLTIGGSFRHKQFEEWRGQTTLSGTIMDKLADWVKGKGWIPDQYFPRIPCTLEKLRIDWDDKNTSVNGTIKTGTGDSDAAPAIRLDLTDTPERFTLRELVISAPSERGKLALEYPKSAPNRISLNWQGFVEADSILKLVNNNIIHAQRLEGDFALQLPLRPGGKNLHGWLKTKGLELSIGDAATPVILNDLNLRGLDDGTLTIERALISSRDSSVVEVNGTVNPAANQLDFKLNLTAALLARTTVEGMARGIGKLTEPADPAETGKKWPSRGTLQFRIDRFEPGPAAAPANQGKPATPASSYVVAPARGFMTLLPSGGYSLDLRSSKVCGVDISGTIYSAPDQGEDSLNFFTDSAMPPLLQEVIPCFGFNNTLIEGPLHLDGSLQGTSRNWRDGKITLFSENGFIRRLGFLAKVFSVVNLTDLFTTQKLPQLGDDGFAYSSLEIDSQIKDNQLLIEKAVVKGKGLNLFGQGKIDLQSGQADLIIMVAPLKSIDAIITNLPLIGTVAGGKDKALLSIPVGLKGDLRDPTVTLLPPEAIGEGIVNLIVNTFKMPLAIFSPLTNIDR
jgi:hypothetical protein